jgi:predicted dehydrogenase
MRIRNNGKSLRRKQENGSQHSKQAADTLKIGIIGVGIGQAHIRGYKATHSAEIVALCDLDTERAQKVAQDTGIEDVQIFSDHRAMLDSAEIDAVSVCLPNSFHAPVSIDCLKAGKHVLCEKPLAMNAKEGQRNRRCRCQEQHEVHGGARSIAFVPIQSI